MVVVRDSFGPPCLSSAVRVRMSIMGAWISRSWLVRASAELSGWAAVRVAAARSWRRVAAMIGRRAFGVHRAGADP